eukprot:TRINITY_DN4936_c0_g1_i1.p1 TRINITY_DN4936_c0_g1~~TRINITY_DN4936_c0_g1_i1.p1  ORF type:complete len:520 (+),score=192.67 TRINITY_DN4936_c0_g1_i1:47-1561(+)
MTSVRSNVVTGGMTALGACYVGSYLWEKMSRPETKAAQNELKEFNKLVNSSEVDDQALVRSLQKMRSLQAAAANKQELLRNIHLFTALCAGKTEFKYSLPVVSAAVELIISLCRSDTEHMLVKTGGVKVLFVALTRAYTASLKGGPLANAARELVEKLLNVLDEVASFDEDVVLPFDVPASAGAARQLASIKTFGSITMLLNPAHGFLNKRPKVLGIISSVTCLKQGAYLIAAQENEGIKSIDQLLSMAAKSDSKAAEYTRATMCVRNLVRHVPACRARVLSTEEGVGDLTNLPRVRDQFIELIDGGSIGYPPRTQQAAPRDSSAVLAGLDALSHMLQAADSHELMLEALLDSNQRGLLALFGVVARCESPHARNKVGAEILGPFSMMDNEIGKFVHIMRSYTGSGEYAAQWGTGFRVAQELHAREQKEQAKQKMAQRSQQRNAMQQQLLQQMMGGGGGGGGGMSEEDMMQQMMMAGAGGEGPPGMPPGMTEEQMMMMMGMQGQ